MPDELNDPSARGFEAGSILRAVAPRQLAFGFERLGLIALRYPYFCTLVAIALVIAAAFGIARIKVDDSLSQLFRSNTPAYEQYQEVTRRFPSSEFDVLVVVEGSTLLERGSLEKLRDLTTDLQLIDGTAGIISLFSARQPPVAGELPAPLFPENLPTGEAYSELIHKITTNEIIRGKLLSADGKLALIVLALAPAVAEGNDLSSVVGQIRKTLDHDLDHTGLTGELSGVPVMQLEIRKAVEQDRVVYNAAGFAAGCLIAIVFFRRVSFMIVAAGPPLTAIVLVLGLLGWLNFQLNIFLNVMTPLIMVISFSDSMQLTFAARDRLLAGESKRDAFRNAILVVGPACVLTHSTAGLSFIALLFSSSDLIRKFGEAGIIATATALLAVLILVPLLGILLVRENRVALVAKAPDVAVDVLRRFCRWIATRMIRRAGLYTFLNVVMICTLGLIYTQLQPRYRLADLVPDKEQAVDASHRLDSKLSGANPIDALVEIPKGQSLYSPDTLATITEVQSIVESQTGIGNVWSLETLRRWLAKAAGGSDVSTLKQYVDLLPKSLVRRFISADQTAVVISGRVADLDASQLLPIIDSLNAALDAARSKHPGYKITLTGLSVIAAQNSAAMIEKLNHGLMVEVVFVAAFIGLAFRSVIVSFSIILPGIFPILTAGDILWALGDGLQFASVVALTVSFGLGLSATIHFLNRLRLEIRPDTGPAVGIERATVFIGPALILTSVVLACGLAATIFSNLPSLRMFGALSAFATLAALLADLLILRPIIMFLYRFSTRMASMGTRSAERN